MTDSFRDAWFFKEVITPAKAKALLAVPVLVLASALHGAPVATVQAPATLTCSEIPAAFAAPPVSIATPSVDSDSEPPHQPEAESTVDGPAALYSVTGVAAPTGPQSGHWEYVSVTKKVWVPPTPSPYSRFGSLATPWHHAVNFLRVNAAVVVVARRLFTVSRPSVRRLRPRLFRWQVPHAVAGPAEVRTAVVTKTIRALAEYMATAT